MAEAYEFRIGANDEHGREPFTAGKRTPVLPYLDRPFYENEFNRPTKNAFLAALARLGFPAFDVKPEPTDVPIATRVARVNRERLSALVTFGYNAFGDGQTFLPANGSEVFYAPRNPYPARSRALAAVVAEEIGEIGAVGNRGTGALDEAGVLGSVNCVSVLAEPGFMTNFAEAKLMLDPDFQLAVAERTAEGLCAFLDVEYFPAPDGSTYPLLRRGARGNYVVYLQRLLVLFGSGPVAADGEFGAKTEAAVVAFQRENGLAADGIVGRNTWSLLLTAYSRTPTLRRGSRGLYVRYAQQKLTTKLYPAGEADGIFGAKTESAVRAFQKENGLAEDGIVGKNTWRRLKIVGGGRVLRTATEG